MSEKPQPTTGLVRIYRAFYYSLSGFKLAFREEAAFRQELCLVLILTPLCLILTLPIWLKSMILFSHVLILIVELLNTAIESIVDLASPQFHSDAKKAKDTGSSAVLLCLLLTAVLWCYAIYMMML